MKARLDRPKKIQPEYHLIVTEGTETEPSYFRVVKELINHIYPDRISLEIHGTGNNTLNLFEKAKQITAASINGFKHVWVVYDTDDFPPEHIDQTAQLCEAESTEETIYHAIWSNQCFELWFLLHFSFMHSDLHRKAYWAKLTDILTAQGLGKYDKARRDMYQILYPYMDNAIQNAKKLDKLNTGKSPSNAAPGTKVHVLIEKLKPYLTNEN